MRDDEGMEREREDRIDALIGVALRSYAEPDEMPEQRVAVARVMDRVREADVLRHRLWIGGWAATACFAVAVVGVMWTMRSPRTPEIAWTPNAPGVVSHSSSVSGAKAHDRSSRDSARLKSCPDTKACTDKSRVQGALVARTKEPEKLPKLEVFPTPRPLSVEEQALVGFVRHGPPAVQRAVFEDQQHWDDPIIVAGLRDQPLQTGSQKNQ